AGAVAGDEGETVDVGNLYPSAQGDSVIIDVLDEMGAKVEWDTDEGVAHIESDRLEGVEFDASDNPDLVPTVAVLGAVADGETHIVNAEHVRYKETDRLEAMATELSKMNAAVEEGEDYLVVDGDKSDLQGAEVEGRHDHRVVMALTVAGLAAEGETVVDTAESVSISYPGFTDAMFALGAEIRKVE
ncbi:MAG: 3-phosphoshikimate 1-carboxyvinyltransferase, partial [Halobacteria archaeon]|nr:3-phosphoshikimate 1-carboxyvinyltransferase [Halobacteria archaeon]